MRVPAVLVSVALVALLAGCVPQTAPPAAPDPVPTVAAMTEEEALAEAEEAYGAYLAMSDLISSEGGRDPERIAPFVTERYLDLEVESARKFELSGLQLKGSANVRWFELQYFDPPELVAYTCYDITDVVVVDAEGNDVTPIDRVNLATFELRFQLDDGNFLLDGSSVWSTSC